MSITQRVRSSLRLPRALAMAGVVGVVVVVAGGAIHSALAEVAPSDRNVWVPMVPCRLFDTRADSTVGPRAAPLGPGETYTQTVHGTNGNCTVPTDAAAISLNVTTVNATAASYLTLWPADAAQPLASNLNWIAQSPPTPNKVDVKLSADGKINLFNNGGTIDVVADVVGYYANHNHDERYFTKAEVDSAFAATDAALSTKADKPSGTASVFVAAAALIPIDPTAVPHLVYDANGYATSSTAQFTCGRAPVAFPVGATLTQLSGRQRDNDVTFTMGVQLYRDPPGSASPVLLSSTVASANPVPGDVTVVANTIALPVVAADFGYFVMVCGLTNNMRFYDATIQFTYP